MSLAKYLSLFVAKYRQTYPHLCTHLRRQLRPSLCLDLDLDLFPKLNLNLDLDLGPSLFRSLFRQLFAALFDSSYESKFEQLQASLWPAVDRRMPPSRRPLGRPIHGSTVSTGAKPIAVRYGPTTTYR
ncbi:hypothetical protein JXD38_09740 [candidate division WOR-3 bacterium]|nr:hypothetical protein [candidate division WOR-3 bacterium]